MYNSDLKNDDELLNGGNKTFCKKRHIIIILSIVILIILIIVLIVLLTKGKSENNNIDDNQYDKYLVKGTFIDTITKDEFRIRKGYILVQNGLIKDFSEENPDKSLKLYDYTNKLIIPGLSFIIFSLFISISPKVFSNNCLFKTFILNF